MTIIAAFLIGLLAGWRAPSARTAYVLARKNGGTTRQAYYVAALAALGVVAGAQ